MEVGLSSSVRTTLSSVQRIKDLQSRTQNRIATGREDQERNRNVIAAFVAKSLSNKASDLLSVKNSIGQGSSQLQVAQNGLESINQTLNQLKAVAIQFENSSSPTQQAELQSQFDVLSQQLDNFARDSSFGGTNLIDSSPDTLNLDLNADGSSSIQITGQASDSATLGLDINNTATIDAAAAQVRATAQTIGSNASVLQIREDFTTDLVNTLKEGEAKLVQTDLNEEAANSLALSTRNQLAAAATNLAIQSEQTILQLF